MSQYHFDFKDWREAFALFYRKKQGYKISLPSGGKAFVKGDKEFCLVVSTAEYVSGYWVERSAKSDKETCVYRSVKAVKELEKRVREQDALRQSHEISPDRGKLVI